MLLQAAIDGASKGTSLGEAIVYAEKICRSIDIIEVGLLDSIVGAIRKIILIIIIRYRIKRTILVIGSIRGNVGHPSMMAFYLLDKFPVFTEIDELIQAVLNLIRISFLVKG